jgi:carbon starvation protein CstA
MIWKYVGITNQMLATIVLWTSAIFMAQQHKTHWVLSIPAFLLTTVVATYFFVAPYSQGGLFLDVTIGSVCGLVCGVIALAVFLRFIGKAEKHAVVA